MNHQKMVHLPLWRFVVVLIMSAFCLVPTAWSASANGSKRILLVESYASLDSWTTASLKGFNEMLTQAGVKIHADTFSLAVRFQPGAKPSAYDIQILQARLNTIPYDMVVAFNNDAADLFLSKKVVLPPGTPLLLDSYSGPVTRAMKEDLNMAVVRAAFDPMRTIQLGLHLLPETKQVVLLIGATADGREQRKLLAGNHLKLNGQITVIDGSETTTAEMLEKVKALPPDTLLVFHSWNSATEGLPAYEDTVLPQITKVFPGMILGRYDTYMRIGSYGGATAISSEQGKQIGAMAVRVLNGKKAAQIPCENTRIHTMLDYRAIEKFRIPASRIPADIEVVNRPVSFWLQYRMELATSGSVLLLVLFASCFMQVTRRREQKKFRLLIQNLPSWVMIVDRRNRILYSHIPDPDDGWIDNSTTHLEQLPPGPTQRRVCDAIQAAFQSDESIILNIERNGKFRRDVYRRFSRKNPFRREIVMCVSTDVTELQTAHRETAHLAERFRLTLRSIGDGVIATDCDEKVTLLNPVAEELTGYSREEAIGMDMKEIFNIVNCIDGTTVPSPLSQALADGKTVELANHTDLIAKNGTRKHIADCAAPIFDDTGKITGGVLVFRDVTDEYEKREHLRLNDEILKTVARIARISFFRCSDTGATILAPPEEYWPRRNGVGVHPSEWVAPKDLEHFVSQWKKLLAGECDTIAVSYSAGTPSRYFELQAVKSVSESTGRVEYYGVIQDVTRSRKAEQQIRDSHQLLRNIMDNLPGYIFVKNADDNFRYVMCNSRFAAIVGRDCEQVAGHFDHELFPKDQVAAQRFKEEDQQIVDSGEKRSFREHAFVTDGTEIIVQTVKTPFVQSDGTKFLLGLSIDISREYELEQQQKQTIKQLDHASRSEKIINQSLSMITVEQDLDRAVNEMLRIIGENANADRAYIFLNDTEDGRYVSNRYEWVREGILPQKGALQRVDMSRFPEWRTRLAGNRDIIIYDAESPAADGQTELESLLQSQEIRSLLISGIWKDDRQFGFVGLDYTRDKYEFAENTVHMVRSIANLFLLARERAMQMQQLAESASLPKQIIDNITIPIAIIDMHFHFQAVNPSFLQLVGKSWDEIRERKCYEIFCRSSEPPPWCTLAQEGDCLTSSSRNFDRDGRSYIVNTQPIFDLNQKARYALKSLVDITEINHQKEELQNAMDQAMAANRAKSFFLATMSHELRTPLNAVIGFSELLQDDGIDRTEQLEYLRSINYAGSALLSLINDVLDLSKLEANQMSITASKTDLAQLLDELVAVFQLKAKQKNLSLQLIQTGLDFPVYVDHQRIRQILLNLIGNAVKFTHHGGITIRVEFLPAAQGDTGTLRIQVIDTGIGIPKEQAQKIFDPFFQTETTRDSHAYEGSGLGLAISMRLAQRMDGTLAVASEPGKGSTFTFTLNQVRYENTRAAAATGSPLQELSPLPHKLRILLVDDVPMNLKVLQAMLRKINAESVCAASGAEAVEILSRERNFDFLLTDLWMPGMNGEQLAKHIHSQDELRNIVVIAVTADTEAQNNFSMNHFDDVLSKPVTLEKLQTLLEHHTGKNTNRLENES